MVNRVHTQVSPETIRCGTRVPWSERSTLLKQTLGRLQHSLEKSSRRRRYPSLWRIRRDVMGCKYHLLDRLLLLCNARQNGVCCRVDIALPPPPVPLVLPYNGTPGLCHQKTVYPLCLVVHFSSFSRYDIYPDSVAWM